MIFISLFVGGVLAEGNLCPNSIVLSNGELGLMNQVYHRTDGTKYLSEDLEYSMEFIRFIRKPHWIVTKNSNDTKLLDRLKTLKVRDAF